MTVTTAKYGNWTTYTGTISEVTTSLNTHVAQKDRTWTFSDGTSIISVVYGG